jgi:hypothetical protein
VKLRAVRAAAAIAGAFVLAFGADARADDSIKGSPLPFPEPSPKDDEPRPGPFDHRNLSSSKVYDLGLLSYRGVHHDEWSTGVFELFLAQEVHTRRFPFYLLSTRGSSIRVYDDKSYGLAFMQDIGGGVAIGPLEPEWHIGAHLVELDVFHGNWNASVLSPRASVEIGIRAGRARFELIAYGQYLWRWFGESYLVRGVSLGLQLEEPKMRLP